MHSVCTFVLRFFRDPETPGEIKGSIQSILEPTPILFSDMEQLLVLVEQLAQSPDERRTQSTSKFDGGAL